MIIHIDCNSFFSSCEVSVRPELVGRPVVVSSSVGRNGIILALSPEAKALGLKRGDPVFRVTDTLRRGDVAMFRADHKLYHDISRRIMQSVRQQGTVLDFVQYSIDEFFGYVPLDEPQEVFTCVQEVKERIFDSTSIPVSCGCADTYTLAKVATWYAKHYAGYRGVCVLTADKREQALGKLSIDDVWGLGRRTLPRLRQMGLTTAAQFAALPQSQVAAISSVSGVRTWQELNGVNAIELCTHERKQSIMCSRTFDRMTSDERLLQRLLTNYTASVAAELRSQNSVCRVVTVFLATNRFRDDLPQTRIAQSRKLPQATADTALLAKTAAELLRQIYSGGYLYKQMGVVLDKISDAQSVQPELFEDKSLARRRKLMQLTDTLNRKLGGDKLKIASQIASDNDK